LEIVTPFSFILAALKYYPLSQGCEIEIQAEFSDQWGFASSASVTVATLAAIAAWLEKNISSLQLIHAARSVIRQVQGFGSGADAAACVLGGYVAFYPEPLHAESLAHYPLTVFYSGSKKKTTDVLQSVKNNFLPYPELLQKILLSIGDIATLGIEAVKNKNWHALGKMMNIHQGLHESLGVSTPTLNQFIDVLRADSQILGAKISGSGLGDCVIGLGAGQGNIPITIASGGVHCEEI
jgi:mevalonate kinase